MRQIRRATNPYERYFSGDRPSLALETDYTARNVCAWGLRTCQELLGIETDEWLPLEQSKTLLQNAETRTRRAVFTSREVGEKYQPGYITTPPMEYWKDVHVVNHLTHATTSISDHGLAFGSLLRRHRYTLDEAQHPLLVFIRDDGEIELSEHQELVTPMPLKGKRRAANGLPGGEMKNIIAYANRAAALELVLNTISRATQQTSDRTLSFAVSSLQLAWAGIYDRESGEEHASFGGRTYDPGFDFGPLTPDEH